MNDVDRWINLEGPEPAGIRELMDAARDVRDVPPMTAEQRERMRHSFFAALHGRRRREAVTRVAAWTTVAILTAGAAAAALFTLQSSMLPNVSPSNRSGVCTVWPASRNSSAKA